MNGHAVLMLSVKSLIERTWLQPIWSDYKSWKKIFRQNFFVVVIVELIKLSRKLSKFSFSPVSTPSTQTHVFLATWLLWSAVGEEVNMADLLLQTKSAVHEVRHIRMNDIDILSVGLIQANNRFCVLQESQKSSNSLTRFSESYSEERFGRIQRSYSLWSQPEISLQMIASVARKMSS